MIGWCCVDTLAYGGYSNDFPLLQMRRYFNVIANTYQCQTIPKCNPIVFNTQVEPPKLWGLKPPQLGPEPPQLERESVSKPGRNREVQGFWWYFAHFLPVQPHNSFWKATPAPDHDIMWKGLTQVLFDTAQPKSGLHISHLNDIHTASPITHSTLNMPECDSPFLTFHKFEDGVLARWCGFPTLASSSLNFKILLYQNVDQQNVLSNDLDNGGRTPQSFNVTAVMSLWHSM